MTNLDAYLSKSAAGRMVYAILRRAAFTVPTLQNGLVHHRFGRSTVAHSVLELRRMGVVKPCGRRGRVKLWRVT